jgi:carbon-monoxide dehydrogenase medium subunit
MKAAVYDYRCPSTLAETVALLGAGTGAKVLAGGQTLGPMLNLRLVQPRLVIDITRLSELKRYEEKRSSVVFGACLTHANFEDGLAPDPTGGFLARVASGIAYRAVRTRGTLGGSLAHADPSADWLSALLVLDARVTLSGPHGMRDIPLVSFVKGALVTEAAGDEILTSVEVGKPDRGDRFGYAKLCRKTGEFAEGIGAVRRFADNKRIRLVSGGADAAPTVIEDGAGFIKGRTLDRERLFSRGLIPDPYLCALRIAALERALDESFRA